MRRFVIAVAFLLCSAAPLFAVKTTLVDDVIRMTRAGVTDDVILAFVHRPHDAFIISADDMIAMSDGGVSKAVIAAVVDEGTATETTPPAGNQPAEDTPSTSAKPADAGQSADAGDWCQTFDPPIALIMPWYPWAFPWWTPDWAWDPYWWMPRYDSRVGRSAGASPPKQTPSTNAPREVTKDQAPRATPRWIEALSSAARELAGAGKRATTPPHSDH